MEIVSRVAAVMQAVLGASLEPLGAATGVIQRQRVFTASSLARTLIFGFWANPRASWDELALAAAQCGAAVSPQAIAQRFTPALVEFLLQLVRVAAAQAVAAEPVAVELLQRFHGVYLLDSTSLALPEAYAGTWAGCGAGRAGMKIQLGVDWLSGALHGFELEPGRAPDQRSVLQTQSYPPRSLRIADLGYFGLETLKKLAGDQVYFLSRIQCGTTFCDLHDDARQGLAWLESLWAGVPLDLPIRLGGAARLKCRLLACRVPEEIAARRRRRLLQDAQRKGRTPSDVQRIWCDWTIYVANVEPERLSWSECEVLYRTRWQIELIFKLWKSEGRLAEATPGPAPRQMATLLARLLAQILQHWCLLSSVWHDSWRSLRKAARMLRRFALTLASRFTQTAELIDTLQTIQKALKKIAKVNKRQKKPSHAQLLENPKLMQASLT